MLGGHREFNEKEFREALHVMEDENVISLNGHSLAPVIRFVSAK